MTDLFNKIFLTSLRRQLVVGIVLVIATMMSMFVMEQIRRQQAAILEQQSELAAALAQSVATSASVWVASRDYSGLQEIINGLNRYPDLQHAIVLDTTGQVLAHTEKSHRGLYMNDLPTRIELEFLGKDPSMVDVASPITIAGTHIGWARVGLGQQSMAHRLTKTARNGMFYTLAAVLLSAFLAMLAARRLTRRLYDIQTVADAVQAGQHGLRANLSGTDEAAQLAKQFNGMLDTLAKRENEIVSSRDALAQSEAHLSQVMAVTGEGIWDWDIKSGLIRHNSRWSDILGMKDNLLEHAEIAVTSLLHEEDREAVVKSIGRCLDGNGQYWSEHRMYRSDGEIIWVQDRGDVVERDSNGRPLRMLGSIADITERKQAEEALIRLNYELEQRVQERTENMTAARDDAQRANAAKSEFLSRMSHELRTPLNAVIGFGQLLEYDSDHPLTENQLDNVNEILHAGKHLLELVNEVLDLSRIESGRIDINPVTLEIKPLIESCMAQLRPLAAQRNIKLSLDQAQTCSVLADQTRLKEVLLNLLSNAVKYNRESGQVRINCSPGSSDNSLRVSVHDTGRGIAAESLSLLFKPFERLESSYDGIEGTGIGLALAKKLVEAMHGKIGVESVTGSGSTFWFELPLANTAEHIAESASGQYLPFASSSHYKLLYIEDNPANLRLVQKLLAKHKDIAMFAAENAETGLTMAAEQQPDIILLDIQLPGMDGFDALKLLRENPLTRDIPVVAVTANAMNRDVERGMAAGFDEYLTKPLNMKKFQQVLDKLLGTDEASIQPP